MDKFTYFIDKLFIYVSFVLLFSTPLIFIPSSGIELKAIRLFIFGILLDFLILLWIIKCIRSKKINVKWSPLYIFILLYFILNGIHTLKSLEYLDVLNYFYQLTFLIVLYFVVVNNVQEYQINTLIKAVVVAASFVSFLGLLQLFRVNYIWIPDFGGLSSTFSNRNYAAMYIIVGLPLSIYLYLQYTNFREIVIWGASIILQVAYLISTRSRGAWLGLVFSLLLVCSYYLKYGFINLKRINFRDSIKKHKKHIILILIILIVLIPLSKDQYHFKYSSKIFLKSTISSIFHLRESPIATRLLMWKVSLRMVEDNFLWGVGINNWQYQYPLFTESTDELAIQSPNPHNSFLHIFSELGIFGIMLNLSIILMFFYMAKIVYSNTTCHKYRNLILLCIIAVLSFTIDSIFSCNCEVLEASIVVWVLMAFISILYNKYQHNQISNDILIIKNDKVKQAFIITGVILLVSLLIMCNQQIFKYARANYNDSLIERSFFKNDWRSVISKAQKLEVSGEYNLNTLAYIGITYYNLEKFNDSMKYLKKYLERFPYNESLLLLLGGIQHNLQLYKEAIFTYSELAQIKPVFIKAANYLNRAYIELGEYNEGKKILKEALNRDPNNAEIYNNIGVTCYYQQSFHEAKNYLSKAILLSPNYAEAYNNLGLVYSELNMGDQAIEMFEIAIRLKDNYKDPYINMGMYYLDKREFESALKIFNKWRQIKEDDEQVCYLLGIIYKSIGDIEKAKRYFMESLKINSSFNKAKRELNLLYQRKIN